MMKKILISVISMLIIVSFNNSVFADDESAVSVVTQTKTQLNEIIDVKIEIDNNPGLAAWLLKIEWKKDAFEFVEDSLNSDESVFKDGVLFARNIENGLHVNWFSSNDCYQNGEVFEFKLKVIAAEEGIYDIKMFVDNDNTINSNEESIQIKPIDAHISVGDNQNGFSFDVDNNNVDNDRYEIIEKESVIINTNDVYQIKVDSNKSYKWVSSDENVVKVNDGKIEAISEGDAIITVESDDGQSIDRINVRVSSSVPSINKINTENVFLVLAVTIVIVLIVLICIVLKRRKHK